MPKCSPLEGGILGAVVTPQLMMANPHRANRGKEEQRMTEARANYEALFTALEKAQKATQKALLKEKLLMAECYMAELKMLEEDPKQNYSRILELKEKAERAYLNWASVKADTDNKFYCSHR